MKIIEKFKGQNNLLFAVIIAFGVVVGGYFVGNGIYKSRTKRIVTVKGLAEQNVVADSAVWNLYITRKGSDLTKMQSAVDSDIAKVRKFLKSAGFSADEIQDRRIEVQDMSDSYAVREGKSNAPYSIRTGVMVRTNKVKLVDQVSRKMGELVRQGITISDDYSGPIYIFNGLNDIKIPMIEQATKNATDAGRQFAKDAGTKLGKIQSANQGVFSIETRDPTERWSDERQSIDKKVRVVSTITFYLE
ncbi:MAG: SIMPL domain-containing protein [Rickettsiales bacterium]|jgi:hypothetical protein|nr:SIMPL domain-containing protein [Rickettsiales bacterium]